ncbi:unnamed protein product [Ambrosiozyma monospora]|uniref:Unnamed protein product n=1 Tax=Ambrosiozyma monospora TaxID=43982 RepID=A0ACB5U3J8_AMBMO|nr:unnamed protein product [Ambrosiozyma monospora]
MIINISDLLLLKRDYNSDGTYYDPNDYSDPYNPYNSNSPYYNGSRRHHHHRGKGRFGWFGMLGFLFVFAFLGLCMYNSVRMKRRQKLVGGKASKYCVPPKQRKALEGSGEGYYDNQGYWIPSQTTSGTVNDGYANTNTGYYDENGNWVPANNYTNNNVNAATNPNDFHSRSSSSSSSVSRPEKTYQSSNRRGSEGVQFYDNGAGHDRYQNQYATNGDYPKSTVDNTSGQPGVKRTGSELR